jgi:hypothetical protein
VLLVLSKKEAGKLEFIGAFRGGCDHQVPVQLQGHHEPERASSGRGFGCDSSVKGVSGRGYA